MSVDAPTGVALEVGPGSIWTVRWRVENVGVSVTFANGTRGVVRAIDVDALRAKMAPELRAAWLDKRIAQLQKERVLLDEEMP